ncbi:nuclear transport factor 2 family protein [Isoptericola cucumis]|uniref:YybH family protein n=1 Tax=Isoptericola cucumis TaxID=1776856 RepID=UPI00320A6AC1
MTIHDENPLRHLVGAITEGLRARDLEALRRLYTPDVVSFDMEPPLQHAGVDAKLENWARVFAAFQEVGYEVRDLAFAVDEHVAWGHGFGRLSGTLRDGTTTPGMWVRVTFGFRRTAEGWRIAHDQVSVPLRLPGAAGATDLEP